MFPFIVFSPSVRLLLLFLFVCFVFVCFVSPFVCSSYSSPARSALIPIPFSLLSIPLPPPPYTAHTMLANTTRHISRATARQYARATAGHDTRDRTKRRGESTRDSQRRTRTPYDHTTSHQADLRYPSRYPFSLLCLVRSFTTVVQTTSAPVPSSTTVVDSQTGTIITPPTPIVKEEPKVTKKKKGNTRERGGGRRRMGVDTMSELHVGLINSFPIVALLSLS